MKEQHGTDAAERKFLRELTTLGVGEGFVWSPAFLKVFRKVCFNNRKTFDSSRTPEIGEKQLSPAAFAHVDLNAVTRRSVPLPMEAKERRSATLRARITELEAELRTRNPGKVRPTTIRTGSIRRACGGNISAISSPSAPPVPPSSDGRSRRGAPPETPQNGRTAKKQSGSRCGLANGACSQTLTRCGGELTKQQLATLADINRGSGTFSDYLRGLVQAGFVEDVGRSVRVLDAGAAAIGEIVRREPPATSEIVNWYSVKLRAGERRMLKILVAEYPDEISKQDLAERAEVNRLSGTFSDYLGGSRATAGRGPRPARSR